jgi:hypothetical protein
MLRDESGVEESDETTTVKPVSWLASFPVVKD